MQKPVKCFYGIGQVHEKTEGCSQVFIFLVIELYTQMQASCLSNIKVVDLHQEVTDFMQPK